MVPDIFIQLAVALGLGLLVGLQRERVDAAIAGIRTFALITLFGAVSAQLAKVFGGWLVTTGNLPEPENPAELKSALVFGALYAVILLAVAFARHRFGTAGLYTVAGLSGLTDMDAITLSTSRLVYAARLDPETGWRTILLASLSNLVFKGGIVAALGSRALLGRVTVLFGALLLGGGLIFWLWP